MGLGGSFHPPLPPRPGSWEAGQPAGNASAWPRCSIALSWENASPTSKTFHATGELETLFVCLPGNELKAPAAPESWEWEHAGLRASPGTPSPVLGNGSQGVSQQHRNWSQTVLLRGVQGRDALTSLSQNPIPTHSHHTPGSPWLSGQSRFKPRVHPHRCREQRGASSEVTQFPRDLAHPVGTCHAGHAAEPELLPWLCALTQDLALGESREEGSSPQGLKSPWPHGLGTAAGPKHGS